jgi:hypothetical protein
MHSFSEYQFDCTMLPNNHQQQLMQVSRLHPGSHSKWILQKMTTQISTRPPSDLQKRLLKFEGNNKAVYLVGRRQKYSFCIARISGIESFMIFVYMFVQFN